MSLVYLSAVETREKIRLQLTLHYDGSAFHGWQSQPDVRTVQGEVQKVVTRLAGMPTSVLGSGRTDSGVHATGQVASVAMPSRWTPTAFQRALNALLPADIWVERAREVPWDFHPRYDARARTYRYRLGLAPQARSPFHRRWCWPLTERIDRKLLDRAAALIPGERSFRSFAKSGQPERGYRCHVRTAVWDEWALGVVFRITADRYLHHMVRYLVGTMVEVARGRRPISDMEGLLAGQAKLDTSPPAPARGLCLERVEYPAEALRPEVAERSEPSLRPEPPLQETQRVKPPKTPDARSTTSR